MKKLLLILFLPFALYSQSAKEITGVWQDMEILASGWSNTYMFYPDSSYKFFYSQMDCSKRIISEEGMFEIKDGFIEFTAERIEIIEGGKIVPADAGCGSDSMIIDGIYKKIDVKPKEWLRISIGDVQTEMRDEALRSTLLISNTKYWKFGNDPDEYIKQFEN
jgi:hypothetical protein